VEEKSTGTLIHLHGVKAMSLLASFHLPTCSKAECNKIVWADRNQSTIPNVAGEKCGGATDGGDCGLPSSATLVPQAVPLLQVGRGSERLDHPHLLQVPALSAPFSSSACNKVEDIVKNMVGACVAVVLVRALNALMSTK